MKILFSRDEWKGLFRKPCLRVMTIFVTNRCDSRCVSCFAWRQLNTDADPLTLEEYRKIAARMAPIENMMFTGGEPTLAPHLTEVIGILAPRPEQSVTMPTNGLKPDRVERIVREILARPRMAPVLAGVSLDGPEPVHDAIRGVKGSYQAAMETLRRLSPLRREYPNFQLTSLTVVMNRNQDVVAGLLRQIAATGLVDYLTVDVLRGAPPDPDVQPPALEKLEAAQAQALALNADLLAKRFPQLAATMLSHFKALFRHQVKVLRSKRLELRCMAGEVTAVLEVDGCVRLCEMLDPVGNVRDYDYDFMKVWHCDAAQRQRASIRAGRCLCTHCVNLGHSVPFNFRAEFVRLLDQRQFQSALASKRSLE
ncbi:MAG: radical SAM protein [Candidatus Sumerlaeota bacterium]|nr:radical SAM protein [Candidatus Sumerlaeota bacterium]